MFQKLIYYLRNYPISICIALGIWFLCLIKPPHTELMDFQNSDKVAHSIAYVIFGSVIWLEYLRHHRDVIRKRVIIGAILLPVLMSGIIEWAQANLTDNRSGEWADFAANTLGVLTAALFATVYMSIARRKRG